MANGITLPALTEVIENTLSRKDDTPTYVDISRTRQRYPAAKQLLKKRRKQLRGAGSGYRWQLKVQRHMQARAVGAFEVEQVVVKDMFVHASVPMRCVSNKFAYDIMEEELNGPPEQLVEIIKARRADAWGDLLDLIEQFFWAASVDAADELSPWPLRHTLLPHTGATIAPGFTAQNPSGWSTKEGLDATVWTGFNNWTAGWNDMTDEKPGFIYRVDEAMQKSRFQAPYPFPQSDPDEVDRGFYAGFSLRDKINQWMRRMNDNATRDALAFHEDPVIKGTPVMWVEDLDSDTTLPLLGVDWNSFEVLEAPGWQFKEIGPRPAPMQPTAVEVFVYKMYNIICKNPRRNFYLNQYNDLAGSGLT